MHEGALRVIDLGTETITWSRPTTASPSAWRSSWPPKRCSAPAATGGRRRHRLLIARVDESTVRRWHIADPANPDRTPAEVGYPAAGTPNAEVSLNIAPPGRPGAGPGQTTEPKRLGPRRIPVPRHRCLGQRPAHRHPEPRPEDHAARQRAHRRAHPRGHRCALDRHRRRRSCQLADGRIAWTEVSEDTRRLIVAAAADLATAAPLTPPGLQVREILGTDGAACFSAGRPRPRRSACGAMARKA